MVAVAVVPLAVFGVIAVRSSASTMNGESRDAVKVVFSQTSRAINDFFAEQQRGLFGVSHARQFSIEGEPQRQKAELKELFDGLARVGGPNNYLWLGFVKPSGHILAASGGRGEERYVGNQPWFRRALRRPARFALRHWRETGKMPAVGFSYPVRSDDQRLLGVFSARVGMAPLHEIVTGGNLGRTGSSYVLSREGVLEAGDHRHGALEGSLAAGTHGHEAAGEVAGDSTGPAEPARSNAAKLFTTGTRPHTSTGLDLEGVDSFSVSAPIKPRGLGLALVTSQHLDELNAPSAAVRDKGLLIGIGGVLIALLAALYLSKRTAAPIIERLRKDARRAEGANRAKDKFLSLVSHSLRTPLTSIRGYLDLYCEEGVERPTRAGQHYLKVIVRNAARIEHLVTDLLFAAGDYTYEVPFEPGVFDLDQVARECVEAAQPRADEREIHLTVEPDSVAQCSGDRDRVAQLFDNLISNALNYTPKGGRVEVRLRQRNGLVLAEVEDSGVGISTADQKRIFERFFRTSSAVEQQIPGLGVGLTIVKAIVEGHGGTISLESDEGVGSTFRVELPLVMHSVRAEAEEAEAERPKAIAA